VTRSPTATARLPCAAMSGYSPVDSSSATSPPAPVSGWDHLAGSILIQMNHGMAGTMPMPPHQDPAGNFAMIDSGQLYAISLDSQLAFAAGKPGLFRAHCCRPAQCGRGCRRNGSAVHDSLSHRRTRALDTSQLCRIASAPRCHQLATTDDRMPTALLVLSLSTAGVGREIIDLASAAQCIKRGAS